jgi:hypothetical protein
VPALSLALNHIFVLACLAAPFEKWLRALGSPLFLAFGELASPLGKFRVGVLHDRRPGVTCQGCRSRTHTSPDERGLISVRFAPDCVAKVAKQPL